MVAALGGEVLGGGLPALRVGDDVVEVAVLRRSGTAGEDARRVPGSNPARDVGTRAVSAGSDVDDVPNRVGEDPPPGAAGGEVAGDLRGNAEREGRGDDLGGFVVQAEQGWSPRR